MMPDLQHLRVLVAEDEYLIANDVSWWLERAGATIVGPTPTVKTTLETMAGADDIQVAVLDINLNGEMIFPVADELARRSIPLIFYSGYDSLVVPERFRDATRLSKCAAPSELVSAVFEQYLQNLSTLAPMCLGLSDQSVMELLPGLRLRARLLMPGVEAADTLVERTLARAILLVAGRPRTQSLDLWLHELLAIIHAESPYGLN
ncbi:response regulator [Ensifer sp.]|jgi:CheY-like chemotaxis protein|uniref:response regulator n=1 Tax=Ensifer sp. TaxID=1872086 RepID=UPI002E0E43AB|nr:response regulator [Ensifer sp.]